MTIRRLGVREAERRVRDTFGWPAVLFAQRYVRRPHARDPEDVTLLNLSDPVVMATAVTRTLESMAVTEVLATGSPDSEGYETNEEGDLVVFDPGPFPVWRCEDEIAQYVPPDRQEALAEFFREAGVRRGFRGGIVATGRDCARMTQVLASYAYDLPVTNVYFVCDEVPMVILACHEGDMHIASPRKSVLSSCSALAREMGLRRVPQGVHFYKMEEGWYKQGLLAYGPSAMLKLLDDPQTARDAKATRSLRRHVARAAREISDPSPDRRAFAAYVLAMLGDEQHFDLAKSALRDDSNLVREAAVDGLRRPAAIPLLAKVLREDPDVEMRTAAAGSLGAIGTPAVRRLLLSAAESDPDENVRHDALEVLEYMSAPRLSPSFARRVAHVLCTDPSPRVRSQAAYVVMIYGGKATIPALADAYDRETDAALRVYIIDAVALSKDRRAVPILTRALADPSYSVRETAAEGVATCGARAAVGVLADAFVRERNRHVRESIVKALGILDTRKSRAVLEQALEDPEEIVREAAAEVLAASTCPKENA